MNICSVPTLRDYISAKIVLKKKNQSIYFAQLSMGKSMAGIPPQSYG